MTAARGFTLLEVLVAVAITAMIGVASSQLLRSVIDSKKATDIASEQLTSLQRFNQVISRDMEQFINRSVRDAYGNSQASLILDNGDYPIEFTRAGWRNSPVSSDPRSTLQRVAYRLEDMESDVCKPARLRLASWGVEDSARGECLVRYFWRVLDRSSDSEPAAQVVLEQVDLLEMDVMVEKRTHQQGQPVTVDGRDWYTSWPALQSGNNQEQVPVALRWRLTLPHLGDLERIWLLAHDGEA